MDFIIDTTFTTDTEIREEIILKCRTVNRHALVIFSTSQSNKELRRIREKRNASEKPSSKRTIRRVPRRRLPLRVPSDKEEKKTDAKGENESRLRESSSLSS